MMMMMMTSKKIDRGELDVFLIFFFQRDSNLRDAALFFALRQRLSKRVRDLRRESRERDPAKAERDVKRERRGAN